MPAPVSMQQQQQRLDLNLKGSGRCTSRTSAPSDSLKSSEMGHACSERLHKGLRWQDEVSAPWIGWGMGRKGRRGMGIDRQVAQPQTKPFWVQERSGVAASIEKWRHTGAIAAPASKDDLKKSGGKLGGLDTQNRVPNLSPKHRKVSKFSAKIYSHCTDFPGIGIGLVHWLSSTSQGNERSASHDLLFLHQS
jgi:hypothetical protein